MAHLFFFSVEDLPEWREKTCLNMNINPQEFGQAKISFKNRTNSHLKMTSRKNYFIK